MNPLLPLYDYQRKWVANKSRFKIAMFARQTGKTFTTTLDLVLDCLNAEAQKKRKRWVILSRGERQAKEAMDEGVKKHLEAMKIAFSEKEINYLDDTYFKALEVTLPGGSRITALPANPDTARGFSANCFLDEFAFHQDSRKIWQALFPVISAGHRLIITSTPNGKGNKFYDIMTGQDTEWYRQTTDIYEAVRDGLPRDIEPLKKALNDEDAWAQEYELKWLDEASAWLPFDLINSVENDLAGRSELYAGNPCYVGVDIAARHDLFVIWVLERVGDVLWTREITAKKNISFAQQDFELNRIFKTYKVVRCAMDQTGMGEKPVEDAKRRHGGLKVEGVLFTGSNKLHLATVGKEAFQDKKIRIPLGDENLRLDLHKIKKETSATGTPRFVAQSDAQGHADRTWALFLAIHAGASPAGDREILSLPSRERNILRGY